MYFSLKFLNRKTLFILLAFALMLLAFGITAICLNGRAEAVAGDVGQKPIYAVDTDEKRIAISFDATWGAEHTETILDILDENEVKTTFFLVNLWMEEFPDMVEEIASRGHEVQLHSMSHPHFPELSEHQMRRELEANNEKIQELTGKKGTLFRPPYGDYNDAVLATGRDMGLEVIQWSVDSLDWQGITASEIIQRVSNSVAPGSIVLFHNNGDYTAEALDILLPQLLEEGYEIVPVSSLIYTENYTVDQNGIQHSND